MLLNAKKYDGLKSMGVMDESCLEVIFKVVHT